MQASIPVEEHVRHVASVLNSKIEEVEQFRKPVRRQSRPLRDVLIYLVWRNSHQALQAIGDYFHVAASTLPATKTRGKKHLSKRRELRALAAKSLMI